MIERPNLIRFFSEMDAQLGNRPVLNSVRRGLTYLIPLIMLGSFALVFISLPVPLYQNIMNRIFGDHWRHIFLYIRDATFNILSLMMVVCISYSYVTDTGERYNYKVSPFITTLVSLSAYVTFFGMGNDGFSIANFGVSGIFVAIAVAVTASLLFMKLSSIRFLQIKAFTDGANSTFNNSLLAIFPAIITIMLFAISHEVLAALFGITDIQKLLSDFLCGLFARIKSPFWSGLLFMFLIHFSWFFGMHGNNIMEPVAQSIFVPALTANQAAVAMGQPPAHIFSKTFFDTFVLMGGCGATICLIIAIFIAGKYKNQLRLAKISLIPGLFNINDLMVLGIPIVLNPVYLIPFLGIPLLLSVTSYLAVYFGLIPYTSNLVEWTTPVFLSGFTATNSIRGSLLQLFNLSLGILCYLPFVRLAEIVAEIRMKNNINRVYELFKQNEEQGTVPALLTRQDDIGSIARFLVADLESDLQHNRLSLFYQPQADYDGNVFGVEALLRWNHKIYGYVYPPLIIALAEEAKLIDKLGNWILDTACRDLKKMNNLGLQEITMSVNISAGHFEDERFIISLKEIIDKHRIIPATLQIEITEQIALANRQKIINQIMAVKNLGLQLAMDDFGMGHSSLMYLKEYHFDTIKLDGSLVRELLTNKNCENIISSIVFLSQSLNYSVLAEFVEVEEQRALLHKLGCDKYQGYLFSKALPFKEMIEYILQKNNEKYRLEQSIIQS